MKIKILLSIVILTLLFGCEPKGKEQPIGKNDSIDSSSTMALKKRTEQEESKINAKYTEVQPQYYICYTSDANANMAITISFTEDGKALKVKYKGQKESMALSYLREDFDKGETYPTIETYYKEMYKGKENGEYKLTHSGNWDYAVYTRSKDGKKFNFTIDHELTIENDEYRNTPCF